LKMNFWNKEVVHSVEVCGVVFKQKS
jgi:hypothetical protein